MKKKIATMLALLLIAATGAWAQDTYTIKATASSQAEVLDDAATLPFTTTLAECYDKATGGMSHGFLTPTAVTLTSGENVTVGTFDGWDTELTVTAAGEAVISISASTILGDRTLAVTITATKNSDVPVSAIEVTKGEGNTWTFTMPAKAVKATVVYDTELALSDETDNDAVLDEWDGYEADVKVTRTFAPNIYNTFAAPFDIDLTELNTYLAALLGGNMVVKELVSSAYDIETGVLTLTFANVTKIEAGKPYLLKVPKQLVIDDMYFKDATVSKTITPTVTDFVDFIPTLGKTSVTAETGNTSDMLYLAAGNELKNPTELPTDMKGFRAYFLLKDGGDAALSIRLNLGDGETTVVKSVTNGLLTIDNEAYDLTGRRIGNAAQKGVYIQKGRKMVVK